MVGRSRFHERVLSLGGLLLVLAITWICVGCTVVQFAAGEKGADVTKIQPGLTRSEAEAVLGRPLKEWNSPSDVTYRTYKYDSGRPPNFADAAASAFMDIASLGLWEAIEAIGGTLKTKYMDQQRTTARLVISYDDQDIILGVFGEFEELPADGRSGPRQSKR